MEPAGRVRLIVRTYEHETPVVEHVFLSDTAEGAKALSRAHMETDAFYRGSFYGWFHGMKLRNVIEWR